jgi:hypothetical protein
VSLSEPVNIGLLDSGLSREQAAAAIGARRFELAPDGEVLELEVIPDLTGHGSAMARVILEQAPKSRILSAQVFTQPSATSAIVVARGLDWLIEKRAAVVNMSFGLRHDRQPLRLAIARARSEGIILLAATPARGPEIYPSAYPGVIRVTGDARCRSHELSQLDAGRNLFGACPGGPEHSRHHDRAGGASHAVAHLTGLVCRHLAAGGSAGTIEQWLHKTASYRGRERRSAG